MPYKNKEDQKKRNKRYYKKNKEKILKKNREYHKNHREEILDRQHRRLEQHREENRESCKRRYWKNREEYLTRNRLNHKMNRERNLELMRNYVDKNREELYENQRQWNKTENGKKASSKHYNKRKRELGFNPLFENNIEEIVDWHHVNNEDVIAIPRDIHILYGSGNGDTESHRQNLESIVIQLYPDMEAMHEI